MNRPLIVMALESEGQGLLEPLGYNVIYTGVGKVNATYALTRHLAENPGRYPFVLNLGTAGSSFHPYGALVETTKFVQRDMDATGIGFAYGQTPFDDTPIILEVPRRFPHLPEGVCGSGDSFLQGVPPIECNVIEMEAFAQAKVCRHMEMPFSAVKFITDGADGNAHLDWNENLKHAAIKFRDLLS